MEWIAVSSPGAQIREYHLVEAGQTRVILRYNPGLNSIRLRAGNSHRLYYLQSSGSLSGRSILSNEYGMEAGQLQWDKWTGNQAVLQLGDAQFRCRLNPDASHELEVIDPEQRLAGQCRLLDDKSRKPLPFSEHPFLLPGLCWYLALTREEEAKLVVRERRE